MTGVKQLIGLIPIGRIETVVLSKPVISSFSGINICVAASYFSIGD